VAGCAGTEAGWLSGQGTGVRISREHAAAWIAPRLDAMVTWHAPDTNLMLGASFGALAPLFRNEFFLDGLGVVHQSDRLVARLGIGIGFVIR
jgi:hypothetical protein